MVWKKDKLQSSPFDVYACTYTLHPVYDTYCLEHQNKENERIKTSNLTVDHFSFNY